MKCCLTEKQEVNEFSYGKAYFDITTGSKCVLARNEKLILVTGTAIAGKLLQLIRIR